MSVNKHSIFIQALVNKLKEIDDPDPEIIMHEGYKYSLRYVKKYKRKLPWITFTPYGSDTRIKAEIMRNAAMGITDEHIEKLKGIRTKHGLDTKMVPVNSRLAKRFRKRWNSYWNEKAKAIEALQDPQLQFSRPYETVAEPIRLMMGDKISQLNDSPESKKAERHEFNGQKSYDDVLAELE